MDNKDAQSRLMDYLYDEMEPGERREFEEILRDDPDLQKELKEIQSMRQLLQEDTTEITPCKLMLINTEPDSHVNSNASDRSRSTSKIYTLSAIAAVAAALLISFAIFTYMNLQITHSDQGTLITFGGEASPTIVTEPDQTEAYITEAEFYNMMNELLEQNSQVMATALQQTREQHQQQMENVIETLTTYYDQRRQQDLVLVSEGLAQLEEQTYYRFLQTEAAFEDLVFALNVQQTEE